MLIPCCWEYKLVQPLWKTVWRFLKELKIELPFNPVIPLWLHTQQNINHSTKKTQALYVYYSTVHNSKENQHRCPTTED